MSAKAWNNIQLASFKISKMAKVTLRNKVSQTGYGLENKDSQSGLD